LKIIKFTKSLRSNSRYYKFQKMNKNTDSDLIVIFRGSSIDSEMVKEVLADNGIMANLKNQLMGSIAPWQVSPGGFEPVEVEILKKDLEKALDLINEFNKSK